MKKSLFLGIVMAFVALFFNSCQVDRSRYVTECSCDVYNTTLRISAWQLDYDAEGNPYYYANFDVPQITSGIYERGSIQLWREFNYGYKDCYQRAMPYCEHKSYAISDTEYGIYTQTVTYEYGLGYICIYLYNNDFDYGEGAPEEMYFHLRIEN